MRIGELYRHRVNRTVWSVGMTADGELVYVRLVPIDPPMTAAVRPHWWFADDLEPVPGPVVPAPPRDAVTAVMPKLPGGV